ncbi:MAG: SPOR domain-containing protein [Bacteroidota bacterium]
MRRSLSVFPLLLLFLLSSLPLQAQFRSAMRTANKEYEIHAYNLAIQHYQEALERRPSDVEALSKIADSYRHLNQMVRANEFYTRAVAERRVSAETRLQHAHVLKALGRYDEAKQWYLFYAREHDAVVGNHYAQSCDYAMDQAVNDSGFSAQSAASNSPSADFGPTFANATQLVFNSARTDRTANFEGIATNHPFVSVVSPSGDLQEPFLLQNGYSSDAVNVGPVCYSPNGLEVIFTRNNFVDGTRMIPGSGEVLTLLIADVTADGQWTNVRPLPFNVSDFNTGFGTFSPDGNAIYFASNRPEGYGGYDIYRADRQGSSWSNVPENLGTVVNSMENEITPFFDGVSLFFASDWHFGMGGFDVFRTELTSGRPSQIFHMGVPINSSRDDFGMIYNANRGSGYVVSNRIGGLGNEDVYLISRASASINLVVNSATTGQPIANANVDLRACGDQVYQTDFNGRYVLVLSDDANCIVTIGKTGFGTTSISSADLATAGGELVVLLDVGGTSYLGQLVDGSSRAPIGNATVQVVNRANGAIETMTTDPAGNYQADLQPFTTYDVSVTANGYEPLRFPLTMGDGSDPNVFGVMAMLPSQGLPNNGSNPGTPGGGVTSGYSVQLASLGRAADLSRYGDIADLGRVYQTQVDGAYKVRLGIYQTRAEAEQAQAALRSRGYNGSFIVTDQVTGGSTGTSTPAGPTPVSSPGGSYYVQVGAFGNPANFDASRASQLGSVVQRARGNLTLMLIGGFSTAEEARRVQGRARGLGYDGAFVVQDVGGTLQKVGQ